MCFFLFGVVFSLGTPSECAFRSMERWLSGLRHTPGKRAYPNRYRGFESLPLRHVSQLAPFHLCSHGSGAFGRSLSYSSKPRRKKVGGGYPKDQPCRALRGDLDSDLDRNFNSILQE